MRKIKRILFIILTLGFAVAALYFYINEQMEYLIILGISYAVFAVTSFMLRGKPTDKMSGKEFEEYCAKKLKRHGYRKIEVTPVSGDYGADLIAYDWLGRKWVFQCKRFKGKVSNKAVQEVVASKAHYNADRAAVMTNSELTAKARELAEENNVRLYELIK